MTSATPGTPSCPRCGPASGAHVTAHPDQVEGAQRLPKPGTETEKLARAIIERTRTPNPHEADYCAARDEFHRHAEEVDTWKTANVENRLAELEPDAAAAIEQVRSGWRQVLGGCEMYAAHREQVRAVILTTPKLNGQALADDGRSTSGADGRPRADTRDRGPHIRRRLRASRDDPRAGRAASRGSTPTLAAPALAERLVGTTEAELDEDAQRLAPLAKPEPPEHVALARRAIEVAEQHDEDEAARRARRLYEQTGLGVSTAKSEWARAFVERMHPSDGEDR